MTVPGGQWPSNEVQYSRATGQPPPPRRRPPWLWALSIAVAALACAIVLAVGSALVLGKARSPMAQQTTAAPSGSVKPRPGGPFLDPINALPQPLWTTPDAGLFPGSSTPSFVAASLDTVLLTSLLDVLERTQGFVALDARTGAKKWEVRVKIPFITIECALSGDSQVLCWRDNPLDTVSSDGTPPHTTRLVFISAKGDTKQVDLANTGKTEVAPLRDGFLVLKDPYLSEEMPSVATAFSSSGEQRWTRQSVGGHAQMRVAEELGLFWVRDDNAAQVFRLSDGYEVGDLSDLKSSSATERQILRVNFHAGGFTAENGKLMDVFNAQGKKVNQIAGWRALWPELESSSQSCGQILLANSSGAIAAADAETGQILWQWPAREDARMPQFSCVGERFLLRIGDAKALGVYELASGKQVGSIPAETDPTVVGTDGSFVLLRRGHGQSGYDAYDLANGRFVWSSPPGSDGQYLFCASRGESGRNSNLMSGPIYLISGKTVARLGQKP